MSGNGKQRKKVNDEELQQIVDRLSKTHTISSSGGRPDEQLTCKDIISKGPANKGKVDEITERLYETNTIATGAQEGDQSEPVVDTISAPPVAKTKLTDIIERMNTTYPECMEGTLRPRKTTTNSISRPPASDEELSEIYTRLHGTQTKSSKGGEECRTYDSKKPPGMGLPMFPDIDGMDKRFAGFDAPPDKVAEVITRMRMTQTKSSQARLDPHAILLYPERTLLMNEPERIRTYQDSGAIVRQQNLQAREKWYF